MGGGVEFKPCQTGQAQHELVKTESPHQYRCILCDAIFHDVFQGVDEGSEKPAWLYGRWKGFPK